MADGLVFDDVFHRAWKVSLTRMCEHPAVSRVYGHGQPCRVCLYTCMKCAFAVRYRFHGGVSCGYVPETEAEGKVGADAETDTKKKIETGAKVETGAKTCVSAAGGLT